MVGLEAGEALAVVGNIPSLIQYWAFESSHRNMVTVHHAECPPILRWSTRPCRWASQERNMVRAFPDALGRFQSRTRNPTPHGTL